MHFDTLWIFVLGKPDFHSIYYNFQTNCWIILLYFSGEADSLCEHFEPSHTVFNDSQFMLWRHQTSSHLPRWNFATGVEVTNPKTADICKRRRVKGLEIILIEKAINFIMIYLKLPLLESNYQYFIFYSPCWIKSKYQILQISINC